MIMKQYLCLAQYCLIHYVLNHQHVQKKMYATREHEARLLVLPKRIPSKNIPLDIRKLLGEIESNLKIMEDPFAFSMIREYQPFDSMHSVNWKSSARMDKLMVNTFNTTLQLETVIIMNLTSNLNIRVEKMQEDIIRVAATIGSELINRKIPVALVTNGRDKESNITVKVAAGADFRHIITIETALARIDLDKEITPVSSIFDDLTLDNSLSREYIFISNERRDYIVEKVNEARNKGLHITYVLPLSKDEASSPGVSEYALKTGAIRWVMDNE